MEETTLIEKLLAFGLGRQEATIYLCLMKNGELTGYEVAKLTGISRSNVYNGLAALVDHGAAYLIEGASTKYIAVAIEEFCNNRIHYLGEVRDVLVKNCPQYTLPTEGYITIEGTGHIYNKIHHMLMGASQRIYFSAASIFLEKWQKEIAELLKRGIKVVLISEELPKGMEELIKEQIIFYRSLPIDEKEGYGEDKYKQIRLIIDSAFVLTGEVEEGATDTCLYSAQRNFVNVFKEAMHNEIKLIELSAGTEQKL